MNTIQNYIENIFSALPKSQEILDLKNELLNNMIDKYNELKSNGKTENEAIGIVISEFGNINELLNEMDISIPNKNNSTPLITLEDSIKFLTLKKSSSKLISIGVSLILLGVSILIALNTLTENNIIFKNMGSNFKDSFGVIILLLFVALSVCIFITSASKLKPYKFIEEGNFEIDSSTNAILSKDFMTFNNNKSKYNIIGVTLCILSPISCLIGSTINDMYTELGTSLLLIIISIAVSFFIYSGTINDSYKKLLKLGEFNPIKKEENKLINAVSNIAGSIATCIFLLLGFIFNMWDIAWIVFPITGILYGIFRTLYNALKNKNGTDI